MLHGARLIARSTSVEHQCVNNFVFEIEIVVLETGMNCESKSRKKDWG